MVEEPRWRRYLRFWGRDPVADVEDELSFHLSERAALNEQRGLAPDAARIEAERRFGDVTRIRSECLMETERATRRLAWHERIADVGRDVRVALRSLTAAPVFTITAGAALALGIGANTAVFTVVSAVLLRPLPYGEPERVVSVHNSWDETPVKISKRTESVMIIESGVQPGETIAMADPNARPGDKKKDERPSGGPPMGMPGGGGRGGR